MINFDDIVNESGVLKSLSNLAAASAKCGDTLIDSNERSRKSVIELRNELNKNLDVIRSLNTEQKGASAQIDGLAQKQSQLTTAYRNHTLQLAQNQAVTDSNNKVIVQMQDRLKQLQKEYEKLDLSQKKDIQRKKEIERELTQTTRAVNGLSTAMNGTTRVIKAAEGSTDALRKSTNDLKKQLDAIPDAYDKGTGKINQQNQAAVKLNAQYQQSITLLKKIESGQGNNRLNVGNYPKGGSGFGSALDLVGAGSLATGAGAIAAVAEAGKAIIEIGAKYERLNLLTENALQNNKKAAAEANALIRNFADHSPADIEEVTVAFNRLVDIGIIPTKDQLTEISDIAIAKNKNVLDYVEAIADAQQGEFERLKEFSVDASKSGDKIIFTYRGVRTTVDNTTTAISDYLIELGKVPGVIGATDKLSKSFWGRWATIKDDIKGVANDIYQIMLPALNALAGGFSAGLGVLKTYTLGLREMYKFAGIKGAIAGFIGDPTLAMTMGKQAQAKEAKSGTPELDKARKQQEEQNKANDAARKKADADEKYAKDARKREAEANRILTEKINNSKAANDQLLAANESAQQDGLISERQFIADRQKITLAGIAERQQILKASGKAESDDYKKLAADKIEAETKFRRDSLKLSLSESKADASKAISGLDKDHQDGSLSDIDYAERKRGIMVASLNEQKQILADAGQANSKLVKEIDGQLFDVDKDYLAERLKIQKKAWKETLALTKDALKSIDEATAADYEAQLTKNHDYYNTLRNQIEKDRASGKISSSDADQRLHVIDTKELAAELASYKEFVEKGQALTHQYIQDRINTLQNLIARSGASEKELHEYKTEIADLEKLRNQSDAKDKINTQKAVADNGKKQSDEEHKAVVKNLEEEKQLRDQALTLATKPIDGAFNIPGLEDSAKAIMTIYSKIHNHKERLAEKETMDAEKRKKADMEDLQDFAEAAGAIGMTVANTLYAIEQQKTTRKLAEVDKREQYELSIVGDSESAKAAVQQKYEAERKTIQRQQDIATRQRAIFEILVNAAVAETKALPNIPLSILIAGLAIGQIAATMAAPLPQYFTGKNIDGITNDNYSGPALIGDRHGRELWQHDGTWDLVDKPGIYNVGRNDVILPNYLTEQVMKNPQLLETGNVSRQLESHQRANQELATSRLKYQASVMKYGLGNSGPSAKAIGKAVGDEIAKHPNFSLTFDKEGFNEYQYTAHSRTMIQKNKHQIGGGKK